MTETKSAFKVLVDDAKSQIIKIEMSKIKKMIDDDSIDGIVIHILTHKFSC